MSRTSTALAALLVLAFSGGGGAAPVSDSAAMLRKADTPRDAFPEGVVRLRVVVNEPGKNPLTDVLELFVQGTDRSLAVFREGKQQGRRILTVGDRVFLIVPGASRPIPVSRNQRLKGAAAFGDIARVRFADEYGARLRPDEERITDARGETLCQVLEMSAKRPGSAYPAAVLWVGKDDGLARRLRLSLASGKAAKDVVFSGYDAERRVTTMEIRDLLTGGGANVTNLVFEDYQKRPLDPEMFDPEGARAVP